MSSVTKSQAVVLHVTKYSDHSAIVHTVDSLCGRKSHMLRGLGKKNSALSSFHNLALLDIISYETPKSTMSYLREWTPTVALDGIRGDMSKGTVAMFISEVLYRSLTAEYYDKALFNWICSAIQALDALGGSIANFHLWFLVSYSTKLGFMPGEIIEPSGLFSEQEADLLRTILRSSMADTMAIQLSSTRRQAFARKMLRYISYHLGTEINARSLDVLHEILH